MGGLQIALGQVIIPVAEKHHRCHITRSVLILGEGRSNEIHIILWLLFLPPHDTPITLNPAPFSALPMTMASVLGPVRRFPRGVPMTT